ncbi:hypothetical protein HO539_07290 [Streptococcus suis]|nr:hypothetical protein [Streptococcus suis]NQJ73098.1 hypothetical protein [Streptococcus suis]NQJ76394.1 hypothetical protein [Streptococcus suis]HEL2056038.1 hypothetical protein [Streptococcus suis]
MKNEHPLKARIEQRIAEERYVIPKERKRSQFNFNIIIIISVLISLGLIIYQIIQYFFF